MSAVPRLAPATRAPARPPVRALLRLASTTASVGLVLLGAACGGGGDGNDPVPVASVALTMPAAASVIAGTTHQLSATTLDASGNALTGRTVTWSSGNQGIAGVSTSGMLTAVAPGSAMITATAEGKTAQANVVVRPVPVASVALTAPSLTVVEGGTIQMAATLKDAAGATLAGRAVTWSSNNLTVAAVDGAGLVTTVAGGTATIMATSEGVTGSVDITVTPKPVASVTVAPLTVTLTMGATQQFTATTRDAQGNVLTGRPVTWSSNNNPVSFIGATTGVATALNPGNAIITATSEGREGTAAVTVTASDPVVVSSIAPAMLVPGTMATINGSGFDASSLGNNVVTIGGELVAATSATPTQLTVPVPCVPSGDVPVRVQVGSQSTTRAHPLQVPQRPLGVGQSVVLTTSAASFCNELPQGGSARYLVTVFSNATSANTLAGFELRGNPAASGTLAFEAAPLRAASLAARPVDGIEATMRRHDEVHARILERNRVDYERARAAGAFSRANLRRNSTRETTPPPALGDFRNIFFTFSGGCNHTATVIRGKAIYVGPKAIIWEDETNTLQSANDAALANFYQRLGQVYERDQHETIRKYFADPLLRDDVTDDDDRIHMVYSQRLNGSGAAAYVTSCDQVPPTTSGFAGSNHGQFFYGNVPTQSGSNLNSTAVPDGWFAFMGRTVVHEVKHIASLSARVANNAPTFEQSWLEEGSARMAEEMWVRDSLHRAGFRANTGWGTAASNGVYCDFHLADATCAAADPIRRPTWGMRRQLNEIRPKLVQPWAWSPYGDGTGQSGAVFYNSTWSLLRYAIDRYGASDEAFLRAFTNSTTSGLQNLTQVAGTSAEQLIAGWGMALYADDYPGLPQTNPDLQFQTWNLRSIYAGLNASPSWQGQWNTAYPVPSTALSFGSFNAAQDGVRGGGHAFYEISGTPTAPQLLHLRGLGGGAANASMRIAIARLQ